MLSVHAIQRHGPLLRNLIRREVRQRHKGSILGLGWNLVIPAVMIGTYTFVFRYIFRSSVPDYALYLVTGMGAWALFATGAQVAASSLVANANLVKKVKFPREILPLSAMAGNALTALTMLGLALILCLLMRPLGVSLVMLPVSLALLSLFTIGVGLLLSATTVYFRDVEHLFSALTMPWFFLTPILFAFIDLPPSVRENVWLLRILHYGNPVTPFVLAVQDSVFWGRWPAAGDLAYCAVAAAFTLALGILVFRRLEKGMAIEL